MSAADMAERQDRVLAELSDLALALARDLQARALAAEDAEVAAELANAFHRVARSVRQTEALAAKLVRDRTRQRREDDAHAVREGDRRVQTRKARLKLAVERLIWTEAEGDEAERLLDELDDLLDEQALSEGFADDAVEAHVARICADLGLNPIAHPREGGDPSGVSSARDPSPAPIPACAGGEGGAAPGYADHPWRSSG